MQTSQIYDYVKGWIQIVYRFITTYFKSETAKSLEIIAYRSQVALLQQQLKSSGAPRPRCTPAFRQLWVLLSKMLTNWRSCLVVVQPATVIRWHHTAFKFCWMWKSRKRGRPAIPAETIKLIKQIHKENPLFSPEKIHEKLVQLGVTNAPAPNTIAKHLPSTRKPPSDKQLQSWKTFLKNQRACTWAMDLFTVYTLTFNIVYVFVLINHGNRQIEHFAVTKNPSADWLKQQLRHATPYDYQPKYLIHDNDPVFLSKTVQSFLAASGIKSKKTSIKSPWQNPIAERVIGILRQELLYHIIPINEAHLKLLLQEYIHDYYNPHRTHQGINNNTPIPSPAYMPTTTANTKLQAIPILGGLYHSYVKVA